MFSNSGNKQDQNELLKTTVIAVQKKCYFLTDSQLDKKEITSAERRKNPRNLLPAQNKLFLVHYSHTVQYRGVGFWDHRGDNFFFQGEEFKTFWPRGWRVGLTNFTSKYGTLYFEKNLSFLKNKWKITWWFWYYFHLIFLK